jgi:hypothetical protein
VTFEAPETVFALKVSGWTSLQTLATEKKLSGRARETAIPSQVYSIAGLAVAVALLADAA